MVDMPISHVTPIRPQATDFKNFSCIDNFEVIPNDKINQD